MGRDENTAILTGLQTSMLEISGEIGGMRADVKNLKEDVRDLKQDVKELKSDIGDLRERTVNKEDFRDLKERTANMERKISSSTIPRPNIPNGTNGSGGMNTMNGMAALARLPVSWGRIGALILGLLIGASAVGAMLMELLRK